MTKKKMQSLGTKMATKAVEKSVKKELKSALPQPPSGARLRSKIMYLFMSLLFFQIVS